MAPNPPINPSRLRAADIGYFDPEGVVDRTGKIVIYTDVFAFTHMLLYLAETQQDDVRTAFPLCLRGTALFWYSTELTPLERRLLSSVPVSTICATLISRFKPPQRFNEALTDTQIQQIVQVVQQICLREIPAPPTPSASDNKDEDEEDEEQPFTPALTTSPSTSALTTSPSTPTHIKSSLPPTPALTTSSLPLTLTLFTSSLLPTSSLLTTSSIRSSFARYIKGQMAYLEGIG
jgi:hypothetical protein